MAAAGTMLPIVIGVGMGIGIAALTPQEPVAVGGGAGVACIEIPVDFHGSNRALLDVIREIERIQADMPFTSGEDSAEFLEDARNGGMYGIDPAV